MGLCTCSKNRKLDPTKTTTLRKQFRIDMDRRFKIIRKDLITSIIDNDCFGLDVIVVNSPTTKKQFDFPRSADKVTAFLEWLNEQENENLLTISKRIGRKISADTSWMDIYIESAYKKGILHAQSVMTTKGIEFVKREINASFFRPLHADRVGLLYTRTFSDLKGITAEMDKQISRILSEGLSKGWDTRRIARDLADRVDKIGITRARTLTRTEVIRAHAEATLNEFEEAGLDGVEVEAEWLTAGFEVCPECEELEGQIFTIEEAHGMLPKHPNCKCTWLPVIRK